MPTSARAVTLLCLTLSPLLAHADNPPPDNRSKVDEATHAIASMNEALSYVKAKAKQAQDSRDPIKLNCVNEKAAQISAIINVGQNSLDDLRGFVAANELEAAEHEVEKINIAKAKVNGYKNDADACVGQIEVGDGKVVVIYNDNGIGQAEDPTAEAAPPPTSYRAAPASPIQ